MTFNLDKSSVLWTLGIAGATVAFVGVVTLGQYRSLDAIKDHIAAEQARLNASRNSPRSIATLQTDVAALAKQTGDFDRQIPREPDLGEVLRSLAQFAEAHDLRPDSIKPGEPTAFNKVSVLPVEVRIRGTFPAIFAMVRDIEAMPRLTHVVRCDITADEQPQGQEQTVTAELDFQVFYRTS